MANNNGRQRGPFRQIFRNHQVAGNFHLILIVEYNRFDSNFVTFVKVIRICRLFGSQCGSRQRYSENGGFYFANQFSTHFHFSLQKICFNVLTY